MMSDLLNLIPLIRRHRIHRIRILLDPVYEAKSKELDEFRNKMFKWTLEFFTDRYFLFLVAIWFPLVMFIWKVHILFILILPAIFIISSILVSVPAYLSFRKELNLDD